MTNQTQKTDQAPYTIVLTSVSNGVTLQVLSGDLTTTSGSPSQ